MEQYTPEQQQVISFKAAVSEELMNLRYLRNKWDPQGSSSADLDIDDILAEKIFSPAWMDDLAIRNGNQVERAKLRTDIKHLLSKVLIVSAVLRSQLAFLQVKAIHQTMKSSDKLIVPLDGDESNITNSDSDQTSSRTTPHFWRLQTVMHTRLRNFQYIYITIVSINAILAKIVEDLEEHGTHSHVEAMLQLTGDCARVSKGFRELSSEYKKRSLKNFYKWDTDGLWARLEQLRADAKCLRKNVRKQRYQLDSDLLGIKVRKLRPTRDLEDSAVGSNNSRFDAWYMSTGPNFIESR